MDYSALCREYTPMLVFNPLWTEIPNLFLALEYIDFLLDVSISFKD